MTEEVDLVLNKIKSYCAFGTVASKTEEVLVWLRKSRNQMSQERENLVANNARLEDVSRKEAKIVDTMTLLLCSMESYTRNPALRQEAEALVSGSEQIPVLAKQIEIIKARGRLLYKDKKWAQVIELVGALVKRDQALEYDLDMANMVARSLRETGNPQEAYQLLAAKCVEGGAFFKNTTLMETYCMAALQTGEEKKIRHATHEALKLDSSLFGRPRQCACLADACIDVGYPELALRFIGTCEQDFILMNKTARAYNAGGRGEDTIRLIEPALLPTEMLRGNPYAIYHLGVAYGLIGQRERGAEVVASIVREYAAHAKMTPKPVPLKHLQNGAGAMMALYGKDHPLVKECLDSVRCVSGENAVQWAENFAAERGSIFSDYRKINEVAKTGAVEPVLEMPVRRVTRDAAQLPAFVLKR